MISEIEMIVYVVLGVAVVILVAMRLTRPRAEPSMLARRLAGAGSIMGADDPAPVPARCTACMGPVEWDGWCSLCGRWTR